MLYIYVIYVYEWFGVLFALKIYTLLAISTDIRQLCHVPEGTFYNYVSSICK